MALKRSSFTRIGLPLVAGAIFPLGLAPFDLWPFTLLSICLLFLTLNPSKSFFAVGWLYGSGLFLSGASWIYVSINVYGSAPVPLALFLTLCFCLGLALLHGTQALVFRHFGAQTPFWAPVSFAALWGLFEWSRSWLLTGFPWLYAGYTAIDSPLRGWVPLVGDFGTGFLITGLAASIGSLVKTQGALGARWATAGFLLLWAMGPLLAHKEWTTPVGSTVAVAVYQPNIPLERKWDRRYFFPILDQYAEKTAELYGDHDIVLWPESALPAYQDRLGDYLTEQSLLATAGNATLITGVPIREQGNRYNSIVALGQGEGVHHKQKLVPFGEYVPLESFLRGLIEFFDLPMSNFIPGPSVTPRLTAGAVAIAPFICYEIVYPAFVLAGAREAGLIVTVSNDSWFGESIGPLQHLQMAQYRAIETGKPVIRGTNNGVSAIIDHRGRPIATSAQFREEVISSNVQPHTGETPLIHTSPWLMWVFGALFLQGLFLRRRGNRAHPD